MFIEQEQYFPCIPTSVRAFRGVHVSDVCVRRSTQLRDETNAAHRRAALHAHWAVLGRPRLFRTDKYIVTPEVDYPSARW